MSGIEAIGRFRGQVYAAYDHPDLRRWLSRLPEVHGLDPISEGRDTVYRAEAPTALGRQTLAVKRFGPEPAWKSRIDRFRGSRAHRAADHGESLRAAGVPTPAPVAWLEHREGGRLREQWLVTAFIPEAKTFRAALHHHYFEDSHCGRIMRLLQSAADAVAALHAAGFEHRDLGNQNLLVTRDDAGGSDRVWIIDLHRAKRRRRMGPARRGRDCARIHLPSDLRRVFLQMLEAPAVPTQAFLRAERRRRKRYALQTRSRRWRHPFRKFPRPATDDPSERDIWIWDDRSMQAIPALSGRDKKKYYRKADGLAIAGALLRRSPSIHRAYRDILDEAWTASVQMTGRVGLGINLDPDRFERELRWLNALGPMPVLARLYHHEPEARRRFAIDAVRRLQTEGHAVTIALVQDRKAVLQPRKWQAFVERAAGALSGFVEGAEIGHAINRVKWGVWNLKEYRGLLEPFRDWEQRFPQIPLYGPAGIDFEYPRVLPLLDRLPAGARWSAFSHHLYVDRRGAPENFQGKYDLIAKLALARAMARAHPRCADRLIISEVNWPLAGTGVWSPVGSPYESPGVRHNDPSVDEHTYAAYMLRYLMLALCSGLAERVFWWNLAAHGFGLIDDRDPQGWRPRPAYTALQQFLQHTHGARFAGREGFDGEYRMKFQGPTGDFEYRWHTQAPDPMPVPTFGKK